MDNKVYIYCDGACSGNPGPGGYGVILRYKSTEKELSGAEEITTNNRMELKAAIVGLKALKKDVPVVLVTDSKYVSDGLTLGWAEGWKNNGWRRADKKPALNVDLWSELLELYNKYDVTVEWVKGHNGHPYNERCDSMAVAEYQKLMQK